MAVSPLTASSRLDSQPINGTEGLHAYEARRVATRVAERKASDLHLKVGNHAHVRVDGQLHAMTRFPRVSPEEMEEMPFWPDDGAPEGEVPATE